MSKNVLRLLAAALLISPPLSALATEPASCRTVRLAEVGWADISATTGLASTVLKGLGYKPQSQLASIPMAYLGMEKNDIDVYLGAWMPSMEVIARPFLEKGSVERVRTNLTGAKYTLAVPDYTFDAGLQDFKDIGRFRQQLAGNIYGIEPGNDGNLLIQKLIDEGHFGLNGFKLVESSEAGMLVQVRRAVQAKKPLVFLAWEPHPMNTKFAIRYLSGGDASFGPDFGSAVVDTHTRRGYSDECRNVGALLKNLEFSLAMENQIMGAILDDKEQPERAAKAWLKANPQVLDRWLSGVSTYDGEAAVPAVRASLGL
ncbi:choline ABC transporter substrate-binding protein [Metapseudomonas furukawaii]|uniref:L-proline glycine betaine binding ABC transporter protein ProX n=1 Tax=Metapseudomonas furukawaii TaxID=1149133 RepID=L8MBQ7_METFU|nr:choline ABC transporter substrate-binding protein [Pseudomonas furukawaii]ELS25412.1 L-proline glycine betaine binding ABC transporter protein ProX [Pseudomonas furukawaii]ELS29156.1 L-proline glycine betaine binding ABC transporter protein ProX [Pseudomonas furukawaii]BAU73935.1 L-proline glycine betaine binding ABC transporter protein ProX [Pseudomonas furukawaii]